MDEIQRCGWCDPNDPLYVRYHDTEWCVPCHEDGCLFEMLLLESFQAGLSWACVLHKREAFRRAFDGFDPRKIATYGSDKLDELMTDASIIRNRRKLDAAVRNAQVFLQIQEEWGSFDAYIWHFTRGQVVRNDSGEIRASSPLSDEVSADLRRRGMKFVGTVILYSYLQSIGVLDDHERGCAFRGKSPDNGKKIDFSGQTAP